MRVLIVEDQLKLANVLRSGMRKHGVVADLVRCGEDAVWMAGATRYDVVTLDVMLPGIDGFETCRPACQSREALCRLHTRERHSRSSVIGQ